MAAVTIACKYLLLFIKHYVYIHMDMYIIIYLYVLQVGEGAKCPECPEGEGLEKVSGRITAIGLHISLYITTIEVYLYIPPVHIHVDK